MGNSTQIKEDGFYYIIEKEISLLLSNVKSKLKECEFERLKAFQIL